MLIATPNPCLDITVQVSSLVPGTVSRATDTITTAGGKGVNVARAARRLGERDIAFAALLPRGDGDRYAALLAAEGTSLLPIAVDGVTRVATIVLEDGGRVTVINGRGADIAPDSWRAFRMLIAERLRPGTILVCSGSLPPGVPVDAYAELTGIAHEAGCRALVDAAPAALAAALPAGPDVVCPNLAEAEGLLYGRADEQVNEVGGDVAERAIVAARELQAAGAQLAVVTGGAAGAGFADPSGGGWIDSPRVTVANPIGAGDAFAAGIARAVRRGRTGADAVRAGMAAGSASCEQRRAGDLDPDRAAALLELLVQMGVQRLLPSRDPSDLDPEDSSRPPSNTTADRRGSAAPGFRRAGAPMPEAGTPRHA